jgi:hypothetical protein
VWFTLKDIGKTQVFNAKAAVHPIRRSRPPDHQPRQLRAARRRERSPMSRSAGTNEVKVFAPTISRKSRPFPVGNLPHGVWPSATAPASMSASKRRRPCRDRYTPPTRWSRIFRSDRRRSHRLCTGRRANPDDRQNLQNLGVAGQVAHLALGARVEGEGREAADQRLAVRSGLIQVLQAAVTTCKPKQRYVLALADKTDGTGSVQTAAAFMTEPAGSAIVNAVGPIRQIVQNSAPPSGAYLVIAPASPQSLEMPCRFRCHE